MITIVESFPWNRRNFFAAIRRSLIADCSSYVVYVVLQKKEIAQKPAHRCHSAHRFN